MVVISSPDEQENRISRASPIADAIRIKSTSCHFACPALQITEMLNVFLVDFDSGNPESGNHWLPGLSVTVALFLALYHVMGFRILRNKLHGIYSRCSWWPYLTTYQGMFS